MAVSDYIRLEFSKVDRVTVVKKAVKALRKVEFDAIAVRGTSGLAIGPIVAYLLKKDLIVVRKSQTIEKSHACFLVETMIEDGTYVILDDLPSTGNTVRTIRDEIQKAHPALKPVGVYFYKYGVNTKEYQGILQIPQGEL